MCEVSRRGPCGRPLLGCRGDAQLRQGVTAGGHKGPYPASLPLPPLRDNLLISLG